jgi:DNA-binding transcriptional LysR family regulator
MFDWNDFKYLLAVACYGSTVAAAKALNANRATVH